MRTILFLAVVLATVSACRTAHPTAADRHTYAEPALVHHFTEWGGYTFSEDGRTVFNLAVRKGRLYCNGVDTGPYRLRAPVRILSDEELLVDGERRRIPQAPAS